MNQNQTQTLKGLTQSNQTARDVLRFFANRPRATSTTEIDRSRTALKREGLRIIDSEFNQMWAALEKCGVGSIIRGRKGKSDRFKWNYSLKQVGQAALGKTQAVEEPKATPEVSKVTAKQCYVFTLPHNFDETHVAQLMMKIANIRKSK